MHTTILRLLALSVLGMLLIGCAAGSGARGSQAATSQSFDGITEQQVHALVLQMADDYIGALGEAVQLMVREGDVDARGRWLAMSFLRNGMGATLDIAAGPNPDVALLDLLVLVALQSWAFETRWVPRGIGGAGDAAAARLNRERDHLFELASRIMTAEQIAELEQLIDNWTAEADPDRMTVALVRFSDFTNDRLENTMNNHVRASGLLAEVSNATAAVDDARLFGERIMWYLGRYPYVLGQQTELTAYRMLDQPETQQAFDALANVSELSDVLKQRLDTLDADLSAQQAEFFDRLAEMKSESLAEARLALQDVATVTITEAQVAIQLERERGIEQAFDRFAAERVALLDDLEARQGELLTTMTELRATIDASDTLAGEVRETIGALDRLVARFDHDPNDNREPLQMEHVRDAAIEVGRASDRLTVLLQEANQTLDTGHLDASVERLDDTIASAVDRLFWRGVTLVAILIVGLALVRLIPARQAKPARAAA